VTIHIDTSALIDAVTGPRTSRARMVQLVQGGHRLAVSTIALYEWRRGPRTPIDLDTEQALFPPEAIVAFDTRAAEAAAHLYLTVRKARGRDLDLAIAACAMVNGARLWTLNRKDFEDVPGLTLQDV
jgi:predicted nucleic acid-binding protein